VKDGLLGFGSDSRKGDFLISASWQRSWKRVSHFYLNERTCAIQTIPPVSTHKGNMYPVINVIAIYPAFDILINEMAMVWKRVCSGGAVQCLVVTCINDVLKNSLSRSSYESWGSLAVRRFPGPLISHGDAIVTLAEEIQPQIIFCATPANLSIARRIQKRVGGLIVLHTEYLSERKRLINRRWYLGLKCLLPVSHYLYKSWCMWKTDRILCSDPLDSNWGRGNELSSVKYLPWPHPSGGWTGDFEGRDPNLSVYVGSLSKAKGVVALSEYYSNLLRRQPDMHVAIIGPIIDAEAKSCVAELLKFGSERVDMRVSCARSEALDLIGRSLFVLSTGEALGWGLIGDAWTSGTPILALAEHYDLKAGDNCLIVPDVGSFLAAAQELKKDKSLWYTVSAGGLETAKAHSLEAVASRLFNELQTLVDGRPCDG